MSRAAACLGAVLALGLGVIPQAGFAAPLSSVKVGQDRPESFSFAFHDADISQVAEQILGVALGVSYTVDPAVTGKMSFRIDQRLSRAQLLEALEVALGASDIVLVREGDSLALKPRAKANVSSELHTLNGAVQRAGYDVVAVPLSYAAPSEVSKALDALSPAKIVVYSNDKVGLLILGGTGRELESALQTIKMFDRSGLEGSKIRWFELAQASAASVADELERVLAASGASGVTLVPLRRLNGIFAIARTPEALDEVGRWVEKLDVPSRETSSSLWVYHPKSASADELAQALTSVLSGQSNGGASPSAAPPSLSAPSLPSSGSTPASAPPSAVPPGAASVNSNGANPDSVRIGVDKTSNTLLIAAPASQKVQLQKILEEIDRTPDQILIEASILEVTLSNDFQFGIDWSVMGASGRLGASSIYSQSGKVAPQVPGFSVAFLDKDVSAVINTLESKTAVEIISSPKIIALDNHTAKIEVGDQVPVITQSAQSTTTAGAPLVNSVDYRNTGVILSVTPRISGEDKVVLDVAQEVSSVSQNKTSGIDSPSIQQRKLESTLVLADGGVVALGGMISSTKSKSDAGLPIVKDIPGLGSLFKSDTRKNDRTELIVLLTARIIHDQGGADRVTAALLADMHEIETHGLFKAPR